MILALESEILTHSNLYFTGSGRPHNTLELDWKILTVFPWHPTLKKLSRNSWCATHPLLLLMKNCDSLPKAIFLTVEACLAYAQGKMTVSKS